MASHSVYSLVPAPDHAAPFLLSRTPNMADYIRHAASCYMLVSHNVITLHQLSRHLFTVTIKRHNLLSALHQISETTSPLRVPYLLHT
ncbi:hypothetical protein E4U58_004327 [Claviceps cyperi]|nr:hypothetical protein E4U58_004327 [Claviceps cyperi]